MLSDLIRVVSIVVLGALILWLSLALMVVLHVIGQVVNVSVWRHPKTRPLLVIVRIIVFLAIAYGLGRLVFG